MARTRSRAERDEPETEPTTDAWTGLLVISFLATIIGLIFVTLDWASYPPSEDLKKARAKLDTLKAAPALVQPEADKGRGE